MAKHYVYFIREAEGSTKIGVSNNPDARLATMQTGNPRTLTIEARLGPFGRAEAYSVERRMHRVFRRWHVRGEWFESEVLSNMHLIAADAAHGQRKHAEDKAAAKERKKFHAALKHEGLSPLADAAQA